MIIPLPLHLRLFHSTERFGTLFRSYGDCCIKRSSNCTIASVEFVHGRPTSSAIAIRRRYGPNSIQVLANPVAMARAGFQSRLTRRAGSGPPRLHFINCIYLYLCPYVKLDIKNKTAARKYTRSKFEENKSVSDATQLEKLIVAAHEAKDYIEQFLVQGVRKDQGAFSTSISSL